jgi:hypothetical protein
MDLMLIERNKRDNSTDLVCISEENQIYVPQIIANSPAYLKKGSVVWVKREAYNVYQLMDDITEVNADDFVNSIKSAEQLL